MAEVFHMELNENEEVSTSHHDPLGEDSDAGEPTLSDNEDDIYTLVGFLEKVAFY